MAPVYDSLDELGGIHPTVAYHLSLHPPLQLLLSDSSIEASYIGGSLSRNKGDVSTDLDIFLVINPTSNISDAGRLIHSLFSEPTYLCSLFSELPGFGSFIKILHQSDPIDIFVNSSDTLLYNPMMHGNIILFDRTGVTTSVFERANSTTYLDARRRTAIADAIYYGNLMQRKASKGKEVSAVRAYYRAIHALADLHALYVDPTLVSYIGVNEDTLKQSLLSNFSIDYLDPSEKAIELAFQSISSFFGKHLPQYRGFLNVAG